MPPTSYSSQLFAVSVWGNFSLGFLIGVSLASHLGPPWVLLGIQLTAPVVGLRPYRTYCAMYLF